MGVPTSGNFSMFGSGDNTTIAGAIVEGGADSTTVGNTTDFNTLKGLADINRFDATYSEGATTLVDITKTSQFRGYPTAATTTTTTTAATTTTTAAVPTLTIYYKDIDLEGWPDATTACAATATDSATVYFDAPGPADWNEAYTGGYTVWGNSAKTVTWAGVAGNRWYKSVMGGDAGVVFEITNGVINNLSSCAPATTTTSTTTTTAPPLYNIYLSGILTDSGGSPVTSPTTDATPLFVGGGNVCSDGVTGVQHFMDEAWNGTVPDQNPPRPIVYTSYPSVFDGQDYYYVARETNFNTSTDSDWVIIKITSSGEIIDVVLANCSGGGGST